MNIKYIAVIVALCLAVVFLGLDKCGSSRKVDKLKGEYKEASEIAKVERLIKEEIIEEQAEQIKEQDAKIKKLSSEAIKTNKDLAKVTGELGDLKKEFVSLEECQVQYDKLVVAFNFAMSIIDKLGMPIEYYDELGVKQVRFPEGSITFGLNEKYEKQVIVSLTWKGLYESEYDLRLKGEGVMKAQDQQIKKLTIISKVKTGIVLAITVAIIYSLLKGLIR